MTETDYSSAGAASRGALERAARRRLVEDTAGGYRTGADLLESVRGVAGAIQQAGPPQRVGLWYGNSIAALEAHLAVESAGQTRVPVDPGAPASEARAVFEAAGVELVLCDERHAEMLEGAVLVHDEHRGLREPGRFRPVPYDPDRTQLLYPRMAAGGSLFAVPVSYANWDATMRVNEDLYRSGVYGRGFGPDERFLTVQQMLHGTGFLGTFPFLRMGLPQVVVEQFTAAAALDAIHRFEPTATFMVPGMVTRLAGEVGASAGAEALSLRRVLYGGAPFAADEMRAVMGVLGPVLVQVYGRMEGGWPVAVLGQEEHRRIHEGDERLAQSFGRAIGAAEVRLRHIPGDGSEVGELCVRSAMAAKEYSDPDGWCALGDVVERQAGGYLRFLRRLDGMINTGSYHVYPREVEDAIKAMPGVREVAVVGEPDPRWGQRVVAYVVADAEVRESIERQLAAALPERLARYKHPKQIRVVDSLSDLEGVGVEPPGA
ncbi:MAG: acyl--CoA ligase [Candidatus Dormibacteraeota bacterium]|nr:acyl--CoA ligase [Candidatus Dormibacteraeota bacterium]